MLLMTKSNSSLTSGYLVDTLSLLLNAEGGVIPVSEVCELLLMVHDILDKAVSKRVGNSALI